MKNRTIKINAQQLSQPIVERLKKRFERLAEKDPDKEILLLFNSVCLGGNIEAVLQFISYMRAKGVPVRTKNKSIIGSAALMLFLVGEKREAGKQAEFNFDYFEITTPVRYGSFEEDFSLLKQRARRVCVTLVDFVTSRTKLSREEVIRFLTEGPRYRLDFDSAKKCGILTKPEKRDRKKKP